MGSTPSGSPVSESVVSGGTGCQSRELLEYLAVLSAQHETFHHVAIWRQPFFNNMLDHHTLVYEYYVSGGHRLRSLKIDWGRAGITFMDSSDDPCPFGDVLERKHVRLDPAKVRERLLEVKDSAYEAFTWNCQHFSRHMFDKSLEAFIART
eukprot:gnl/TRDRNA2_/TRDRNA2_30794_c0_seq1.p1 gnl/TRDRNA2_/TRDRNA2_30794_c0~~gnl/TRDRNA2_/TRDRNA2_30794_c0_seq1.p1  ORF type:complete len:151 (-),score=15.35 gnl/TRDRNA2_/TRDRNA2_30794_c0_seq1:24-476(-)